MKLIPFVPVRFLFLPIAFIVLVNLFIGCRANKHRERLSLNWENNRAVSVRISNDMVEGFSTDDPTQLQIKTGDSTSQSVLGEFSQQGNDVLFQPIVPFTVGMRYRVLFKEKIVGEFTIPQSASNKPTLRIFPSQDSLPENILKMYVEFSAPMVEGQSLRHIHLQNKNGDTLSGIFLELQPELWNADGNLLTLWLDPGRIKRDLIPNKLMGNPLIEGESYTLHVSGKWKSKDGLALDQNYSKSFVVGKRDETVPNINSWRLTTIARDTRNPFIIQFSEPLDYSLIQSTITILDQNKKKVSGEIEILQEEKGTEFTPANPWQRGEYIMHVQSRLEDLAGNNLLRPFDRDLKKGSEPLAVEFFERKFVVK